jgi:CHAT domain-containing protein
MTDFNVRGIPRQDPADPDYFASLYGDDVGYVVRQEVKVAGVSRGDATSVALEGDDDDVIEVVDTDGVVTFHRAGSLVAKARASNRGTADDVVTAFLDEGTRGSGTRLAAVRRSAVKLPPEVAAAVGELDALMGPALTRSGVLDSAQGVIVGRVAAVVLDEAAKKAAGKLVDFFDKPVRDDAPEDQRRRKPKTRGVYRVTKDLQLEPADLLKKAPGPSHEAYLVLLHGTFSHTEAAFATLRGTPEWNRIVDRYDGRVLAVEHATLGLTPTENALKALPYLPDAPLHLVTHSRGGLVGEVLSYAATHKPVLDAYGHIDHPDRDALPELRRALAGRDIKVERFVRVACPAMGTTLASRRIDKWASFLFNVFNLVPVLRETGMAALVKKFLMTLLEQRVDPRVMPGLEAQMPESPFLRMLLAAPPLNDGLGSIAGDVQGRGLLNRLLVSGADLFYGENHDFVVPTSSMSGGAARVEARRAFFQGPAVNHGSYFANEDSRQALDNWLEGREPPGFKEPPKAQWPVNRGARTVAGEVLIVPDILGSTLSLNGNEVWPDVARLVAHGPRKVFKGFEGESAGLVTGYTLLRSALSTRYEETPWHYDPRRELDDLAAEFAGVLRARMAAGSVPHIVAHGTGGLIVLAALALEHLCAEWNKGSGRAVLLGPPLEGSWLVKARLAGKDEFTAAIALLDHKADATKVGEWLRSWPLLDLLLPGEPAAAERRKKLLPDNWSGITAVYGSAERTVWETNKNGDFLVSANGDGFVARPSGIVRALQARYAVVPHADLPADPDTVAGVLDLLTGRTPDRLLAAPTTRAGGTDERLPDPRGRLVLPTAEQLVRAVWGGGRLGTRRQVLRVGVVHGDLRAAEGAVLVGHQDGTPISGAERALDSHLAGALERRIAFRQYPGRLGTSEVFGTGEGPVGVVLGLGDAGDVTPGGLTAGVTGAVLKLAAMHEDRTAKGESIPALSISAVLIGTILVPPMPVENSLTSIITGVRQANRRLADLKSGVVVDELKIVELYEERAIQATKAAIRLAQTLDRDDGEVVVERRLIEGVDGKPGAPSPYREGVWRTIRIVGEAVDGRIPGAQRLGALSFTSIGRSARAEQRVNTAQRKLLDALVKEAIGDHKPDKQLYNTLYELLVPNALKGQGYGSENLLLVVDEEAGSLPLEMLASRSHDQDVQPLAVEVGVVRRLETRTFADTTRPSSGHAALVIGDPGRTGMPRLPEAREEALRVARLLRAKGYEVTAIISEEEERDEVVPILNALFRHEYRIVHVAGHGHYDESDPTRSGVVIGDGVYLGALEIAKMRTTPDVVFLNCCHLGAMRRERVPRADLLAASISRQLIENGVRAVIAAGWAVEDSAANEFATTFYNGLLDGNDLGSAALDARRAVHEHHRATNTWGAYQVYGPPGFRLDPSGEGVPQRDELVARREFNELLADMRTRARDASDSAAAAITEELETLLGEVEVPLEWLGGPEHSAIGDIWASLAKYKRAVASYQEASQDWGAFGSVRSVEQLLNVQAKWAVERVQHPDDDDPSAEQLLGLAEGSARLLLTMGETPERWSLLGGVARRRAHCVPLDQSDTLTDALVSACDSYNKAVALYRERYSATDYYSALNAVVLGWVVSQRAPERQRFDPDEARKLIAGSRQTAAAVRQRDFWSRVTQADADLAEALVDGELPDRRNTIAESYFAAFVQSSRRDRAAVLEHVDVVRHSLPASCEPAVSALDDLRERLAGWTPR